MGLIQQQVRQVEMRRCGGVFMFLIINWVHPLITKF